MKTETLWEITRWMVFSVINVSRHTQLQRGRWTQRVTAGGCLRSLSHMDRPMAVLERRGYSRFLPWHHQNPLEFQGIIKAQQDIIRKTVNASTQTNSLFIFFLKPEAKTTHKRCLVEEYYLMLRGFAPQFQLSQPARIMPCLGHGVTLLLHTNTWELLSGGSYPNERHKFLTGVLIRAGNRRMVKRLWVWPQVNFNISTLQGRCTWTINESLREGGGGMVENHVPLQQKWNMAGSDGMHRKTMRIEEWEDRSLQPEHHWGGFLINWNRATFITPTVWAQLSSTDYWERVGHSGVITLPLSSQGRKKRTPSGVVPGLIYTSRNKYIRNCRQTQTTGRQVGWKDATWSSGSNSPALSTGARFEV